MRIGAVVVASGHGFFRYVGGVRFPKVLEDVGGEPMISRIVRVVGAKINPVVVIVNPLSRFRIKATLTAAGFTTCRYAVQPQRRGAADAIMRAIPILRHEGITDFLAIYADMPLWTAETIAALADQHRREQPILSMVTVPLNDGHPVGLERYGRVIRDGGEAISYVVEPVNATPEELAARTVNPSLWAWRMKWFAEHVLEVLPVSRSDGFEPECCIPPLVGIGVADGQRIIELRLGDPWEALGVNSVQELELVREVLRTRTKS